MDLARNKEKKFHHGWFVVRNRSPSEVEKSIGSLERLDKEATFFDEQPWTELSDDRRGTIALKNYLAGLLCSRIGSAFPVMLKDINTLRNTTTLDLKAMGTARTTVEQKRSYLTKIAHEFEKQASQSLQGRYDSIGMNDMKLRMKVFDANDAFALRMRVKGHCVAFTEQTSSNDGRKQGGSVTDTNKGKEAKWNNRSVDKVCSRPVLPCPMTSQKSFRPRQEKDGNVVTFWQSINSVEPWLQYSFEELRLKDYTQTPIATSNSTGGSFASPGGKEAQLLSQIKQKPATSVLGQQAHPSTESPFGQPKQRSYKTPVSQSNQASGGGLFGSLSATSEFSNGLPLQNRIQAVSYDLPGDIYEWIREEIKASRGTELKGTLNPDVLPILFHKQARRWRQLSEEHFSTVSSFTLSALTLILQSVCTDVLTRQRLEPLIRKADGQGKDRGLSQLSKRMDSILSKHLQTNNPAFEAKITIARKERFHAAIERYRLAQPSQFSQPPYDTMSGFDSNHSLIIDMRDTTALFNELHISNSRNLEDEVHDTLKAYYEIAREDFVEYVNQQIVESYLDDPEGPVLFFSPTYTAGLSDMDIKFLAAENEGLVERRESKTAVLARLDRAKEIAERHSG